MSPTNRVSSYHASDAQYYKSAEESLLKALGEKQCTENDVKLVKEFTHRLRPTITAGRYFKITSMLMGVRRFMDCPFEELTEDGMFDLQYAINTATFSIGGKKGKPYSENTKTDWLKVFKRFYLFLSKRGMTKIPFDVLSEMKTGTYNRHTKTEDDVLTSDEITKLIRATNNPRDRCYFSMLYESGARSIELSNLKWRDIAFQDWGALITLTDYKGDGKAKYRTVPIVVYAKFLYDWRNTYGLKFEPAGDNWVFTTLHGTPMTYANVNKILKECARRAKIARHVTLHRIRHSRITHVLRDGMSETIAKKAFWGNLNTPMIETYCHLTTNDVTSAYLNMAGFKDMQVKTDEAPKPVQCPKCHHTSPPGTYFCPVCGTGLVQHLVEDVESAQHAIEERMMRMTDKEKIEFAAFLEGYKG